MKIETILCICLAVVLLAVLLAIIIRFAFSWKNGCTDSIGCNPSMNHCCYRFQGYRAKPIASDIPGLAPNVNEDIANPWGVVWNYDNEDNRTNELWVAQNEAGLLSLLSHKDGSNVITARVPPSSGVLVDTGSPSGITLVPRSLQENNSFLMTSSSGGSTGPAQVLVVTEDGLICGYNQSIEPSQAVIIKDNSATDASYKGCTITAAGRFYACNFFTGRIEVYDTKWNLETTISDSIMLALGYTPFNILCHRNALYVTFALQDGVDQTIDIEGPGNGFILVYDLNGNLLKRLVSRGVLNSPWGMAIYGQHLFVANSGDGIINVFDRCSGRFIGSLLTKCNVPLVFEGLKGLVVDCGQATYFCNHKKKCSTCSKGFVFTAGINNDTSGLIGNIQRYK